MQRIAKLPSILFMIRFMIIFKNFGNPDKILSKNGYFLKEREIYFLERDRDSIFDHNFHLEKMLKKPYS